MVLLTITLNNFTRTEDQIRVFMSSSRLEKSGMIFFVRTHSLNDSPDSGSIFLSEVKEKKMSKKKKKVKKELI